MLATLTIAPPCARIQASTTSLVSTSGPRRLTSKVLSQALSSTSRVSPKCGLVAALFTRMSMRPKRSITWLTSRAESSARPTCATWARVVISSRKLEGLQALEFPAGDDDPGPLVRQRTGRRLANAAASARHDRHAIGQVEIRHGQILSVEMDFDHSPRVKSLQKKLDGFIA